MQMRKVKWELSRGRPICLGRTGGKRLPPISKKKKRRRKRAT